MQDVPKIVRARLQRESPAAADPHPDADLLTAFAEQSLTAREQEPMLEHLARCGECREVVALALPATEAVALTSSVSTARIGCVTFAPSFVGQLWLRESSLSLRSASCNTASVTRKRRWFLPASCLGIRWRIPSRRVSPLRTRRLPRRLLRKRASAEALPHVVARSMAAPRQAVTSIRHHCRRIPQQPQTRIPVLLQQLPS